MCNYINWHADANGYVIQCEACSTYQVSFGTMMLTIDDKQFKTLTELVARKKEELVPAFDPDIKCILLPTPCKEIHGILSERELGMLYHMLQKADDDIRSAELLKLFNVL